MSVWLLDVNVLLALLDTSHQFHDRARHWFHAHRQDGWATCVHTQAGYVRIAAQSTTLRTPVRQGLEAIQFMCNQPGHQSWQEDFSLSELQPEIRERIQGHKQLTDAILLTLAIRRGGRFATFDQRVTGLLPEDSPHQNAIEIIPV